MLKVSPDTYSSLDRFGLLGWLGGRGAGVVQPISGLTEGGPRKPSNSDVPGRASSGSVEPEESGLGRSNEQAQNATRGLRPTTGAANGAG